MPYSIMEGLKPENSAEATSKTELVYKLLCALHDVGQDIRMISWQSTSILQRFPLSEELKSSMEEIKRHSARVAALVEEALNLPQSRQRNHEFLSTAAFLTDELDDLFSVFRAKARAQGLSFDITMNDSVPKEFSTDFARLKRILANLLANAFKFTDVGAVSVNFDYAGDLLKIDVYDTGRGIPEDHQQDIFFPFNQVRSGQPEANAGTGLGLFNAKILANALGGDLMLLSSSPGRGSAFRISIKNQIPSEGMEIQA